MKASLKKILICIFAFSIIVGALFTLGSCSKKCNHKYVDYTCTRCGVTDESCFEFTYIEKTDSYSVKLNQEVFPYIRSVSIPGTYNKKPVTVIEDYAFLTFTAFPEDQQPSPNSIYLGKLIDGIIVTGFVSTSYINEITIPKSITHISEKAFFYCHFDSISLEKGNKAYYMDGNCLIEKATKKLVLGTNDSVIPDNVTAIGTYAFSGCDKFTYISLPESVRSIGECAFSECYQLTSITIPSNVEFIDEDAFSGCSSLYVVYNNSSLDIEIGKETNGHVASYAKALIEGGEITYKEDNLRNYELVNGFLFESYKSNDTLIAYAGDSDTVRLPDDFYGKPYTIGHIRGIKNAIIIPDTITSIDANAFSSCKFLAEIIVDENNQHFKSIDGNLYTKDGKTLVQYAIGKKDTSFEIPNGVEFISDYAFYYCSSLTSITIPDSVTSIGSSAFYNCYNLTSVTIPDSVASIGSSAFSGCSSLTGVHIDDLSVWCNISFSTGSSNPLSCAKNLYLNGELVTELVIPNDVTKIRNYAFYGCDSLTGITIPDSVTSIGSSAFYGCDSLTSVTIPDIVTTVGNSAFAKCQNLQNVTMGNSVTTIGSSAFIYCSKLDGVEIPDSVTTICDSAFYGCSGLKTLTIGSSVSAIGGNSLSGCFNLADITVDDNNTYYKSIDGNLYTKDGKTLIQYATGKKDKTIEIPDGVTSISTSAFQNASALESVVIPDSVTSFVDLESVKIKNSFEVIDGAVHVTTIFDELSPLIYTYDSPFYGCSVLKNIVVDESNQHFRSIDGNLYTKDGKTLIQYALGKEATLFEIPYGVESIGIEALRGCTSLTGIVIPDSVKFIDEYAFVGCSNICSVEFKDVDTWYANSMSTIATSGKYETTLKKQFEIPASDLADPAKAAEYLTSEYYYYVWTKE